MDVLRPYLTTQFWFICSRRKVTYGLNIKVLFEVEEDGKVIKSYTFNDTIKIKNGNATQDDIMAGYKKLISHYREVFFNEIHNQFTKRYL
ncbi:MAG: hypothetical protein LRY52_10110 [Sulfurospirillum cavolei]|nr:hypothetical protein [Sulfurospirillum cavolei]